VIYVDVTICTIGVPTTRSTKVAMLSCGTFNTELLSTIPTAAKKKIIIRRCVFFITAVSAKVIQTSRTCEIITTYGIDPIIIFISIIFENGENILFAFNTATNGRIVLSTSNPQLVISFKKSSKFSRCLLTPLDWEFNLPYRTSLSCNDTIKNRQHSIT
jgi:hypothetical protein